jgi:hypothetical protein
MRARHTFGILVAATAVACGSSAIPGPASNGAVPPTHAVTLLPTDLPTAAPATQGPLHPGELAHYLVWLRTSGPGSLELSASADGATRRTLDSGAVAPDWSRIYTLVMLQNATRIRTFNPATGAELAHLDVPGIWDLPTAAMSGVPDAVAAGGRYLTLADSLSPGRPGRTDSSFLIVDTSFRAAPQRVDLHGDFLFDGLSADGQRLFLLENVTRGVNQALEYHVRRYDVAGHSLAPGIIVDKRSSDGNTMAGTPLGRTTTPDGRWQLTAYAFGPGGPFVHALNLVDSMAVCLDLPATNDPNGTEMQLLWSLTQTADHRRVFAVNGGTGAVVEISLAGDFPGIARQSTLAVPQATPAGSSWLGTTAEAKRLVSSGAVLSGDGSTLYAVGDAGVIVIDTATLTLRRILAPRLAPGSLALSPDGRWLFVVDVTGSPVVDAVELASGAVVRVPVSGSPETLERVQAA